MNRYSFVLAGMLLLLCHLSYGQIKVTPGKEQAKLTTKDTFALNILTTVDKVLRIAQDVKQSAFTLQGELLRTGKNGAGIFRSSVQLPGSIETVFSLYYTYRHSQSVTWQWQALLINEPKGTAGALITAKKARVDSILQSFQSRNLGSTTIVTRNNLDVGYRDEDKMFLNISFTRSLHNSEQQVYDSLMLLYKPLLMDIRTVKNCAEQFAGALKLEDLNQEMVKKAYLSLLPDIANRSVVAAFLTLLESPNYIDLKATTSILSTSQQEEMRALARKKVEEFYREEDERINGKKPDPVVAKTKEIEKQKTPSDPCEKEKWELKIKPGAYITVNGQVAYVMDYSCKTHLYKTAWVDPVKKKLLFDKNVPVITMNSYSQTSASPFSVCSNCQGIGYLMQYDWYQTGTASNFYARSNDQRQYSCGICRGAGFIKIR